MSMIGITQGMQPLISFYYGKKHFKSIRYIFKLSIISVSIMALFSFGISMLFTTNIVSLFLDNNASTYLNNLSINSFRIYSFCFLLLGFNIMISGFCAAIEKPFYETLISLSRGLVIVVLVLILLTSLFGSIGIWVTTTVSESICLLISLLVIKQIQKQIILQEKKVA